MRRIVIDLIRLLGADDADVVSNFLNFWKQIRDVLTRFSTARELRLAAKTLQFGILQKRQQCAAFAP